MKQLLLTNGRQVAVHFYGKPISSEALPLVLLHGFCEDSTLWEPLIPYLTEMSILAIDLPGFGQSDLPVAGNMELFADSIKEVVDILELQHFVLVGHSLGGYVALEFAASWGDRLAGLGLFHSHPYADNEERKTARRRGIELLQSGKRNLYVSQLFPNLFSADFMLAHPEVLEALISNGQRQSAEGIIMALEAMIGRRDHRETLQKLACPALFLLGAEDALVPLDEAWRAALLPEVASIEILPEVAHMGMFEAPAQSAAVLKVFCRNARLISRR